MESRTREYAKLLAVAGVVSLAGVGLHLLLAAYSRDYFVYAKGVDDIRGNFWLGVAWVGFLSSYGLGLLAGALQLFARPGRRGWVWPLAGAVVGIVVGAWLLGERIWLPGNVSPSVDEAFLRTWGARLGSGSGALAGLLLACTVRRRA